MRRAGMPVLVVSVLGLVLSACGQRGDLVLPKDLTARESKAIYIFPHTPSKPSVDDDTLSDKSVTAAPSEQQ